MVRWAFGIGLVAVCIALAIAWLPGASPEPGTVTVVTKLDGGVSSLPTRPANVAIGMADAPEPIRRARVRMLAQSPAPAALERALRSQLAFLDAAAGAPAALTCRAATCMLTGTVAGDPRRMREALAGAELRDTLASWQFAPSASAMLPAIDGQAPTFVLVIDRSR